MVEEKKIYAPRKLNIAGGVHPAVDYNGTEDKAYKNIDLSGDADIVHDLFKFPWPIKTSSVSKVFCSHFVEHIPHDQPVAQLLVDKLKPWDYDGWWMFWREVHRICKKDAELRIMHPYLQSARAFWDPTHRRFIPSETWYYLNKEWRVVEGIDHYVPQHVNFNVGNINLNGIPEDVFSRNEETRSRMFSRNWNTISNLDVPLTCVK